MLSKYTFYAHVRMVRVRVRFESHRWSGIFQYSYFTVWRQIVPGKENFAFRHHNWTPKAEFSFMDGFKFILHNHQIQRGRPISIFDFYFNQIGPGIK
jgi:hypothetical protein